MPETHFTIQWPDGHRQRCYSPSTVIESYFKAGSKHDVPDFIELARVALDAASERVRARYGYACSSALDQFRQLQQESELLAPHLKHGIVKILEVGNSSGLSKSTASGARTRHFSVVIIGGGQAGLSMSYLLKQANVDHVVLEKNDVGHAWENERWDSFCLVTPNWQCRLPGYSYSGSDPNGFMIKTEIVEFLRNYAASFEPPLEKGVVVERVTRVPAGGFRVTTSVETLMTDQVVVATGGYHEPKVPSFASLLPADVFQMHSRDYKNVDQLPPGEVLVVGSGQSGCQIVEDLMLAGRRVHLSVGDAPRCARRYRGKDVVEWLELMGHYDIPVEEMPDPQAARSKTNHYVTGRDGGHDLDLREFAMKGLRLHGTVTDFHQGALVFLPNLSQCLDSADDTYRKINRNIDAYIVAQRIEAPPPSSYEPVWAPDEESEPLHLTESGITSIVWSIGFAPQFSFLDVPVFDERGVPRHQRGVTDLPGMYFLGLPWLHTWGSGRFCGVRRDAEFLLECIEDRIAASGRTVDNETLEELRLA